MMKKITIQRMAAMLTASALLLMMAACGNSPAKEETPRQESPSTDSTAQENGGEAEFVLKYADISSAEHPKTW